MTRWRLLGDEIPPLEEAKEHGVHWTRELSDGRVQCLFLPGYIVANLGHVPSPEIAETLVELASARR